MYSIYNRRLLGQFVWHVTTHNKKTQTNSIKFIVYNRFKIDKLRINYLYFCIKFYDIQLFLLYPMMGIESEVTLEISSYLKKGSFYFPNT